MHSAAEARVAEIGELVARVEAIADPEARLAALSLMEAILALHGTGFERMIEIVLDSGESGKAAVRRFTGDSLVSSLLVLHDLHPDDIETRAVRALSRMSGSAEVLGVFGGVVRIRLNTAACGLRESVEAALHEAIPDATELVIEEAEPVADFVPVESLGAPTVAL